MTEQPRFPAPWTVRSNPGVSYPYVQVPMTHGNSTPPAFLRLEVRRPGIGGTLRLTPRPVLKSEPVTSIEKELTVPDSLGWATRDQPVTVSPATENAYRRYRLRGSAGSVVAAVATILGGALLALGAIWPKSGLGQVLLFSGGGLSLVAAIAVVRSAWRAID